MSLRDLIKGERLKIQLSLNQAKGLSQLGGIGGEVLRNLVQQRGDIVGRGSIRNRQVAAPGEPGFQPKTPILSLFMGGSRPLRETVQALILSTQSQASQPQLQEETPEASNPEITQCPMCESPVLESFEFCPSCAYVLTRSTVGESKSLSIQI